MSQLFSKSLFSAATTTTKTLFLLRPALTTTRAALAHRNTNQPFISIAASQTRGFRPTPANMTVHNIQSQDEFKDALKNNKVVFVDFYATWCGPCKAIAPIVEKLSNEFTNIYYVKVDVDDQPEIAAEHNVRAMPTLLLFKDGVKAGEVVGAAPPKIIDLIKSNHPETA